MDPFKTIQFFFYCFQYIKVYKIQVKTPQQNRHSVYSLLRGLIRAWQVKTCYDLFVKGLIILSEQTGLFQDCYPATHRSSHLINN